jgi:LDH2 family malate/lactate/ureidoglycolate dehydrogenase
VVLDISNTNVARGKIYSALERGEDIPVDWAITRDGEPTTDPTAALDGMMLPMGAYKGYGISFMMDILSGVLTGSRHSTGVTGPYVAEGRSGCGHLAIALKVDRMVGDSFFANAMDDLIETTKGVPLAPGAAEIFYPGEPEARSSRAATTSGVALPAKTISDLRDLASSCGVKFDLA